jgi:hypothetical protein
MSQTVSASRQHRTCDGHRGCTCPASPAVRAGTVALRVLPRDDRLPLSASRSALSRSCRRSDNRTQSPVETRWLEQAGESRGGVPPVQYQQGPPAIPRRMDSSHHRPLPRTDRCGGRRSHSGDKPTDRHALADSGTSPTDRLARPGLAHTIRTRRVRLRIPRCDPSATSRSSRRRAPQPRSVGVRPVNLAHVLRYVVWARRR